MILVPAAELTEGMIVGRDVRDRNMQLVVPRGANLDPHSLRLLQRMDIPIYIAEEGDIIRTNETRKDVVVEEFCTGMDQALASFQRHMDTKNISIAPEEVEQTASALREDILSERKRLTTLMDMRRWSERLFQHSFNTAVMASAITRKTGRQEEPCRMIALGMMFHDCGQLFLPREVFEKQGRLTDDEMQIARKHPEIGYQYIKQNGILPAGAAEIVYHHHERLDGTGYPQGLSAEQLKPLARIAAVIEVFDAMTSLRSYARASTPDEAMKNILSQIGRAYDREVALLLTRYIILYPVGTAVRLNTGECGTVIDTTPGNPTRPTVRLFFGGDGIRIPAKDINLAADTSRMVVYAGPNIEAVKVGARN